MEETIRRMAKVLGAQSVEAAGHTVGFMVRGSQGAAMRVHIDMERQRFMCVLDDAAGITRCSLDLAPISECFEEPEFPGRVTLRVGHQLVHLDTQPNLGIELESIDPEYRSISQRMRATQATSDAS